MVPIVFALSKARDCQGLSGTVTHLQLLDDAINTQQGIMLLWMVCNISSCPCTLAAAYSAQDCVKLPSCPVSTLQAIALA